MLSESRAAEAAIDWLIRQQDPGFAEWEAFTAWLEADPANSQAYDHLAMAEAGVVARLSADRRDREPVEIRSAPGSAPRPFSRRGFIAGAAALAASIVAVVGVYQLRPGSDLYTVATAPGEQHVLTLEDGTSIALNGGTRVTLDRGNERFAAVESGEVVFDVVHDDARPFTVEVAGDTLVDLGTRFDVLRDAGVTEVSVAEGVVLFNPKDEAIRLEPGRKLRVEDGKAVVQLGEADAEAIGSWRQGVLIYQDAPLAQVARDLSRNLGVRVVADPSVAARPVTGVVQLAGERDQLARRLERLFNIKIRQSKSDWTFTPSS